LEHAASFGSGLQELATGLPSLQRDRFDAQQPDLYGQVYQFVFNGTFEALLEGDSEAAAILYEATFLEIDHVRQRLLTDLESHDAHLRSIYSVEPVVGAMELGGYALLLHELNGEGIWPIVKQCWDRLFDMNPQAPELITAALAFVDGTFALTTGGIERSRRSIELNQLFESRGIKHSGWDPFQENGERPHPSPIVSAFAPSEYGIQEELHHLFVAEYFVQYLPRGSEIGHQANALKERIEAYRNDDDETSATGEQDA
jgi:hypothetical protein